MKKAGAPIRTKDAPRRKHEPRWNVEEEKILQKAAVYCLRTFPMLWTVGGIEEADTEHGVRRWIIAVYLRYPTGFEGYLGDLLYDGRQFIQLTDQEIMRKRARRIETDPALQQEWDEYRAATLRARKA